MPGRIDRVSRVINAAPDDLYRAFSDPVRLVQWLPPTGMTGRALVYDFREGGQYVIELTYDVPPGEDVAKTTASSDVARGRFLVLEPGRRITQTVLFDADDPAFAGEMLMTWTFVPLSAGTDVTVTAENVPVGISKADHELGMTSSLENLASHVR